MGRQKADNLHGDLSKERERERGREEKSKSRDLSNRYLKTDEKTAENLHRDRYEKDISVER